MARASKARVAVTATGAVHVFVHPDTLYNLDELQRLTPLILGPLGCLACHSGRELIFKQEEVEFEVQGELEAV
jgi:hypothetical protein